MTLAGATRLRQKLEELRGAKKKNTQSIAGLEQLLGSATVVEAPTDAGRSISFGARVTVRDASGQLTTYRIVGVDELDLYSDAVSWISPTGRALLAAELGQKVTLPQIGQMDIVDVEYPNE
jgi:transcription elongation factor GreB